MRRNTVRLLKYAVLVGAVLLVAPAAIRLLQSGDDNTQEALLNAAHGLPVEPPANNALAAGNSELLPLVTVTYFIIFFLPAALFNIILYSCDSIIFKPNYLL